MPTSPSFPDALARLRDVFAFYHQRPTIAANSLEFEDCTYDAARAARAARVSFPRALRGAWPRGHGVLPAGPGCGASDRASDDPLGGAGLRATRGQPVGSRCDVPVPTTWVR